MELFIQIRNGQPFEHPILGDNFREAFPHIDTTNLPQEFARFERISNPDIGIFEVIDSQQYAWVNGIVKDTYIIRQMTSEEETQKRDYLKFSINLYVNSLKEMTISAIENAVTEDVRQAWTDYLAELNSWVLIDETKPFNELNIPKPLTITEEGIVLTTDSSGTTPNVIG